MAAAVAVSVGLSVCRRPPGAAFGGLRAAPRNSPAGSFADGTPQRNPMPPPPRGQGAPVPRVVAAAARPLGVGGKPPLSSVSQSSVNLVKNIVGSGMFSLPAGVAAFSGDPRALVPSLTLTVGLGLVSAYTFVLIADACRRTGETTYQGAWAKTVGPRTKFLPAVACLAKSAISCIAFSMIFGDCLSTMLSPFALPAALASRSSTMLAITALVIFPLCNMKSLAPLAKFSMVGVLSNLYISFFILLRAFDGSYRRGGALAHAAPYLPRFAAAPGTAWSTMSNPGVAVLLSILATAYLAHYNAALFWDQLAPGPDGEESKRRRIAVVSVVGFSVSAFIFSMVMGGGFLTFGKASAGLILNNYAATDSLATLARLAILLSLVTGYPITFLSARNQIMGLLGDSAQAFGDKRPKTTTLLLLSVITVIALNLTNLGKLAAFAGSVFGSFLIYIAPPLMVLAAQRRGIGPPAGGLVEQLVNVGLIPLGVGLGILGATQSLR